MQERVQRPGGSETKEVKRFLLGVGGKDAEERQGAGEDQEECGRTGWRTESWEDCRGLRRSQARLSISALSFHFQFQNCSLV